MSFVPPHNVVIVVDGPDPDNFAAILAATGTGLQLNTVAVILTGRPVNGAQRARKFSFNPHASRAVNRDNALHAKGVLMRNGRGHVPVFEGMRAPYTTIPHTMHIHERVTDIFDDAHAGHTLAGTIEDAVAYLAQLPGTLHFVCGGPLTDVAYLLRQPMLHGKFGLLTAQLGFFGAAGIEVLAGGRKQFNATADAHAAHDVLHNYPGPLYMVPTDITKLPEFAFQNVDELAALATSVAFDELVAMYRAAWPEMWGKRGIPMHMHDFHPAELMGLLLGSRTWHHEGFKEHGHVGRYAIAATGIGDVPHLPHDIERWGEINLMPYQTSQPHLRFWADSIRTDGHRSILGSALNAPGMIPRVLPILNNV